MKKTKFEKLIEYLKLDKEVMRFCGTTPDKSRLADCENGCENCPECKKKHSYFTDKQQNRMIQLISSTEKTAENFRYLIISHDEWNGMFYLKIYLVNADVVVEGSDKDFSEALAKLTLKGLQTKILSKKNVKEVLK